MITHPNRSRAKRAISAAADHDHEADYAALLASVNDAFGDGRARLFTTNAADLYERYLDNLPAERDVHSCTACRRFIETFGGLVTIGENGRAVSAFWRAGEVPAFYAPSIKSMQSEVERARVTGPFLSAEPRYGMPKTGTWTHFAVTPPKSAVFKHALLSAGQAMAAKREDFRTVASALADFTPAMLTEALRLLEAETLARSERFVAPVRWLLDLHTARAKAKDSRIRDNLLWRAIASAPEGFCHPRASVVGSLLEDIAAGLSFADVKARFDSKLHPLQYQRPQVAPAAGAIAAAEKAFAAMGLAPALERRYARVDEVQALWRPTVAKTNTASGEGIFGHLAPKGARAPVGALDVPAVTMTWEKFARTILPGATAIDALVPSHGHFIGMTTAADADAPPLIRWDREDARNPFGWYVWHGGSAASQWGLSPGWCAVTALVPLPPMWGPEPAPHLGEGIVVALAGAQDTREAGNSLFPEFLRPELHGYRSVVEAYSKRAKLGEPGGPAASGLDIRKGQSMNWTLRVTSATGVTAYRIDRWD